MSFNQLSEGFKAFAKSPLTAVTAGLAGLGGIYASSTSGAKDLRSATVRLTTTFSTFAEGLAVFVGADGKGGGLLDGLVANIKQVLFFLPDIQGDIAVRATNALDDWRVTVIERDRFTSRV